MKIKVDLHITGTLEIDEDGKLDVTPLINKFKEIKLNKRKRPSLYPKRQYDTKPEQREITIAQGDIQRSFLNGKSTDGKCSLEGCDGVLYAKGYCRYHYNMQYRARKKLE